MPEHSLCPVGRVTVDEQFHMREADAAYLDYFGNDVIYSILRTIDETDAEALTAAAAQLLTGQRDRRMLRARNADGQYQWMLVTITAATDAADARCYRLTFRDVLRADRLFTQAEQELRQQRHLLAMTRDYAFRYSLSTRQIELLEFDTFRTVTLLREPLEDWKAGVLARQLTERGDAPQFQALCRDIAAGTYRFQYELDASFLSGGSRSEHLSVQGMTIWDTPEEGIVLGIISSIHPKFKTKDINLSLETNRDSLTDLLNKQAIVSYAKQKLTAKPKGITSIVLVDVDGFKDINDRYGHLFGDEVLFSVARILKAELGSRGMAGRIGGGIFQLVLEELRDSTDLRGILRAIRTKVEWAFAERGKPLKVTCSIGAACYPTDALDYDSLFMQADKALYIASAKGKNRYVIYDVEKHGAVDPNRERSVADLYLNTPNRSKPDFIGELALRLLEPSLTTEQLMQEIGEQFGLDALHIYGLPDWKPVRSWGAPVTEPASFLFENNFLSLFSSDGVYVIDNANSLEGLADAALRHMNASEIMGAVLYLIQKDGTPVGLLSCNLVNRFRKWSTMDVNYLTILGKIVAGIYLRELSST